MKQHNRLDHTDQHPGRAAVAAVVMLDSISDIAGLAAEAGSQNERPLVIVVAVNGIEELAALGASARESGRRLIALSSRHDAAFCSAARAAGFSGVVSQNASSQTLLEAIAIVAGGEPSFADDGKVAGTETAELSPREREVLQLLSDGNSTKQIAATLKLSGKTIETHRLRIMRKLKIFSVAELTKYAIRSGLTRV